MLLVVRRLAPAVGQTLVQVVALSSATRRSAALFCRASMVVLALMWRAHTIQLPIRKVLLTLWFTSFVSPQPCTDTPARARRRM
jgi:hypothetical protein